MEGSLSCIMDPEISVLLHCATWRGLLESQVQVQLSARFNRHKEPALERHIEEVWTERVTKEPWLFNGAKFRLHSFSLTSPQLQFSHTHQSPCMEGSGDTGGGQCGIQKQEKGLCETEGHLISLPVCGTKQSSDCGKAKSIVHQREKRGNIDKPSDRDTCCDQRESALNTLQETQTPTSTPACCVKGELAVSRSMADSHPCPERDSRREEGPILTLRLGLTCYKDFLGTNWSRGAGELCRRGEAEFGDPLALLAQPLGVGGVLCTADRQVVLIRRSWRVAEAGGLLDIPGGHPEPKAVCEGVCEDRISVEMLQQREEAVVRELYSSVCAEIRDEVNVPLRSLGEPVLMGIALNHTSAGRPSAEFYISCSLTSAEVRELYRRGGAEAHESTDIVFLSRTEILLLDKSSPLWSELCPSAKGAVVLYQLVLPDKKEDTTNQSQTPATSPDKISR